MKIAVIGNGKMGKRWANVVDKKHLLYGVYTHNYKDIPLDKIDAVIIAVPHKYLCSITRYFIMAGKHVLCEKPGAIHFGELLVNNYSAYSRGLVHMIGYNCRFHDGFIKARKIFDEGKIGKLMFIRARFGFGGREGYNKEWRLNKDMSGGGHLHDQGVHMINMALSFMDEIIDVKGMVSDMYWKAGTEDNGFVLLKDKRGVIASIHSSLTQWDRMHEFELYGDMGYLKVQGLGMRYGKPEQLVYGKRTDDPDIVKETIIKCNPIADRSLELELEAFLKAIRTENDIYTSVEACETLRIVEKVYQQNL